jgi:hypothetical protein
MGSRGAGASAPSRGLLALFLQQSLAAHRWPRFAGAAGVPQLTKSRAKNSSKPTAARATTLIKKNARRTNYAVGAEAQRIRPDLKVWCKPGVINHLYYSNLVQMYALRADVQGALIYSNLIICGAAPRAQSAPLPAPQLPQAQTQVCAPLRG